MPSELPSYVPVSFYQEGAIDYPTADGRRLRITGEDVGGVLAIRNETRVAAQAGDEEDAFADLPSDVLAAELRLADSQGRLWATTSRFGADRLLARCIDLSYSNTGAQREPRPKRGSKSRSVFDSPTTLSEVICSSDDRGYRYLTLDGEKVVSFKFEYMVLAFDVALVSEADEPEVRVRLRQGCLFDMKTEEDLGGWIFPIHWQELFRCNTHTPTPDGGWQENALPLPLTFDLLEGAGQPQVGVIIT
jgi:hypothetical protein